MNRTLLGFIKKELIQSLRDPRMKFLLLVMPLVQLTLFGVAISNEVKNIRLAAVFEAKDYVLRDAYERALAGGWFIAARTSGDDPFAWVRSGQADAVLIAPAGGFTRALGRGEARVQLLLDATNVLQAQSVEEYARAIISDTLADDLGLRAPRPPIAFDVRVLFNPALETAIFMVPGVM
jgi:ABC-2 type transport system permease protein